MNIYLIVIYNSCQDCFYKHAIIANNTKETIELARKMDDDNCPWSTNDWEKAVIEKIGIYIGKRKKAFIAMSSFRHV